MLNVIIIDDEITIREGLKTIIDWNAYGFDVVDMASNGQGGLEKIRSSTFDLAIVDIKMPFLNGLEMIEHLKEVGELPCHVILLTAYEDFNFAKRAINLGVDGYLLKPIATKELIEKLEIIKTTIEHSNQTKQKLLSYNTYEQSIFVNDFLAFSNEVDRKSVV